MVRIVGWFGSLLVPTAVAAAGLADISNRDAINGLKEALTQGSHAAVARLGVENGFFRNDRVKIPLPPSLRRLEAVMRSIGMDRHADELVLRMRSEEHTSELQSRLHLVCRLLLEKKKKK